MEVQELGRLLDGALDLLRRANGMWLALPWESDPSTLRLRVLMAETLKSAAGLGICSLGMPDCL